MAEITENIISETTEGISKKDSAALRNAYEFSCRVREKIEQSHGVLTASQNSGVVKILKELNLDENTVISGFFHDLYNYQNIVTEIEEKFGSDISDIVKGYGKLDSLIHQSYSFENEDDFINLMMSVAEDTRIIFVFIANRYYKIMNVDDFSFIDQKLLAERILTLYAPLVHRFGLGKIKAEIENSAFRILNPEIFHTLSKQLSEKRFERERTLNHTLLQLEYYLKKYNVASNLAGRTKHLLSIYRKMQRTNRSFEQIYDVMAVRTVVNTIPDCYKVLAIVQQHYKPILEEFDDYIQKPKLNGYQSLHVLLEGKNSVQFELQIRTPDMDKTAEYGVAAHWQYKEGREANETDRYFKWIRDHVDFKGEVSNEATVTNFFHLNFQNNDIFVLTPKGEFKRLSRGSTPIDFAFSIHREVGLHCSGARVNEKIVPFETELKNGDRVEIMTANKPIVNSDWIKYAKTNRAKSQIRRWLREQLREHSIKLGEEILTRGFKRNRHSLTHELLRKICDELDYSTVEDLYAAVGAGTQNVKAIIQRLNSDNEPAKAARDEQEAEPVVDHSPPHGITVGGMDNLMVSFGKCCMPIPGDPIIGYITRGKGVTIHRTTCRNVQQIKKQPDRQIDVLWSADSEKSFMAGLRVELVQPEKFIKEITPKLSVRKMQLTNYTQFQLGERDFYTLVVQVHNTHDLIAFMNSLKKMKIVKSVVRLQYSEYKSLIKKTPVHLSAQ